MDDLQTLLYLEECEAAATGRMPRMAFDSHDGGAAADLAPGLAGCRAPAERTRDFVA